MKAIVTGVTGQDGYYMVQQLLREGFEVLGLTSNLPLAQNHFVSNHTEPLCLAEFNYMLAGGFSKVVEDYEPNFIFNFAAKATGQGMFDAPYEINRLNGGFVIDILEALRQSRRREEIVFCQSSSSEMYGNVTEMPQSEETPFRPKNPYGAAKLYAHNMVNIYRANYAVRCCSAILYNHESVRRSTQFVTKKIANAAALIKLGRADSVTLGSLDAKRDWGYAPEYVDAIFRMARADSVEDYVVATGRLNSVRDLCEAAFGHLDLSYLDFVQTRTSELRVAESFNLCGDTTKIKEKLGWSAKKTVKEIMIELVEHEIRRLNG